MFASLHFFFNFLSVNILLHTLMLVKLNIVGRSRRKATARVSYRFDFEECRRRVYSSVCHIHVCNLYSSLRGRQWSRSLQYGTCLTNLAVHFQTGPCSSAEPLCAGAASPTTECQDWNSTTAALGASASLLFSHASHSSSTPTDPASTRSLPPSPTATNVYSTKTTGALCLSYGRHPSATGLHSATGRVPTILFIRRRSFILSCIKWFKVNRYLPTNFDRLKHRCISCGLQWPPQLLGRQHRYSILHQRRHTYRLNNINIKTIQCLKVFLILIICWLSFPPTRRRHCLGVRYLRKHRAFLLWN